LADKTNEEWQIENKLLKEKIALQDRLNMSVEDQIALKEKERDRQKALVEGLESVDRLQDGVLLKQKQGIDYLKTEVALVELKLKTGAKIGEEAMHTYTQQKAQLATLQEIVGLGDEVNDELNKTTGLYGKVNAEAKKWAVAMQSGKGGILAASKAMQGFDSIASKGLGQLIGALKETLFGFDSVTKQFTKATQLNETYTDSIASTYKELNLYGATLEEVSKAQMDLVQNVTEFTLASESQRNALLEVTTVLGDLGVATADTAKGVQGSMKFFGQSISGATATAMELESTAEALGVIPGEMAAQYAQMGPAMAKFGAQGIKSFKELSRIQKITGMEMQKVLNITNKFDTFEGAADQAGKLNAALGGNFVNAMDLMMATDPAERFGMIRDSILDAGLTFDDMSYYQKQFYTESLGLGDVGDLALMLSGDMSTLGAATDQSAASLIEQKEKAQQNMEMMEQLKSVFMNLATAVIPLAEKLTSMLQFFQKSPVLVETLVKGFAAWKIVSAAVAIHNGVLTTTFGTLAVAQEASSKAATRGKFAFKSLMIVLAGLALFGLLIQSPSLLVATFIGLAAGLYLAGKASDKSVSQFSRLAPALVGVGLGVLMITGGIALMAAAFSLLNVGQMIGMGAILIAMGVGAYFLAPALVVLGTAVAAASPGLGILALTVAAIGGSIFIAAAGVGLMANGFATMFASMDVPKIAALGILVVGLALAGPGLFITALGLGALALGLGGVAFALAFIPTKDLEAIALFTSSLASIEIKHLSEVAETIERVAKAMDSIPKRKTFLFTHVLETAAMTAAAIHALRGPTQSTAPAAAPAAAGGARSGAIANVTVEMHLDGRVFDTKVVKIVKRENEIFAQEVKKGEI
jgi:hypothetical protein